MQKIEMRGNINYAAEVYKVPALTKAENSDRLYQMIVGGMSVIVDESWLARTGELMVVFPAESQLSFRLASGANLHRHPELNTNPEEAGYLEDNRRVRAIRLRGNPSNALALPLETVESVFGSVYVQPGDAFDHIGGAEVVKKYERPVTAKQGREEARRRKVFKRVIGSMLPEHYDTANIRFMSNIRNDTPVYVTQKLHGTSVRIGNVPTLVKPSIRQRIAKWFGVRVAETEYDVIGGSRRVIKDIHDPYQGPGFYGAENDIWAEAVERWGHRIPEGFVVYGELIGWAGQKPIQRGFTYNLPRGEMELYVYRVCVVATSGEVVDLPWPRVKVWCQERGLKTAPDVFDDPLPAYEVVDRFDSGDFSEAEAFYKNPVKGKWPDPPVPLSDGGPGVDEGYAFRVEHPDRQPEFFKLKFDEFLEFETRVLDDDEEVLS